ncbi:hypothetical protein B0H17DRAFT_506983 [Mycena rosella]|uniref:Uncharacterized protein n=1 Tax=Mycena rosella TaxID=1033263 RepID=A0AAD7FRV5_MYCRO|nr:hypothetical protein B0H17DRAFT_506983 [Mycena rosella]
MSGILGTSSSRWFFPLSILGLVCLRWLRSRLCAPEPPMASKTNGAVCVNLAFEDILPLVEDILSYAHPKLATMKLNNDQSHIKAGTKTTTTIATGQTAVVKRRARLDHGIQGHSEGGAVLVPAGGWNYSVSSFH